MKISVGHLFLLFLNTMKMVQSTSTVARPATTDNANPFGSVSQLTTQVSDQLIQRYPDMYTCKNKYLLTEMYTHMKETYPLDISKIYDKIIESDNVDAFDVLLKIGLDPFTKGTDRMSAYDNLEHRGAAGRSENQKIMFNTLHTLYKTSTRILNREAGLIDSIRSKYMARHNQKQPNPSKWNYVDGSKLIHQVIIGNNSTGLQSLIDNATVEGKLNDVWGHPRPGHADESLQQVNNIKPIGWTAVMLAVALNRTGLVQQMAQSGKFNFEASCKGLTASMLIMRLPDNERVAMLKAFGRAMPELQGYPTLLTALANGVKFDINVLRHYLATYDYGNAQPQSALELFRSLVDPNAILTAINKLSPEELDMFFDTISPLSEQAIANDLMGFWKELKKLPSDYEAKKVEAKFVTLLRYKFRMNAASNADTPTPFIDLINHGAPDINLHLLEIVLQSLTSINDAGFRITDGSNENLLLTAFKAQNITVVNWILDRHVKLGLELDTKKIKRLPDEVPNGEGYIHYAIRLIDSEEELIKIVKKLIRIKGRYLRERSLIAIKNYHSYPLINNGATVGTVSYAIHRRNKWTPLMYAVAFRKDRLAKKLIKWGANLNTEGMDHIRVDEICSIRIEAFKEAYNDLLNKPSTGVNVASQNAIDSVKLAFITENANILENLFKKELEEKLKI